MPITASVLQVADTDPARRAIIGPTESISYGGLVEFGRALHPVIAGLLAGAGCDAGLLAGTGGDADISADAHSGGPTIPPPQRALHPARELRGIPVVAVSVTSAFDTARLMTALAGYRVVVAAVDPRWPVAHRVHVVTATGVSLVITDSADLPDALRDASYGGAVVGMTTVLDRIASAAAEPETVGHKASETVGHKASETVGHKASETVGHKAPGPPPTVRDGDEPFLLLFSSGTTGNPKAFLKTREQYRQNFAISSAHLEPLPGVVTLAPGPISYSLTLYAVIESLASGGTVVVDDGFDPIAAGHLIREHGVTRVVAVPAMVHALAAAARRAPERFARVNLIVTGGANLSTATRERIARVLPGTRIISYYGAAEIGFIGDSRGGDGTVITVYDGVSVQIRADDGSPIQPGSDELGELWVKAAARSDGYLAGTADEQLLDAGGWATVHDQARWAPGEPSRVIKLLGRAGDIAITGGHKVSLAEVDHAFSEVPGLRAACAVALPDDARGTVVALVVEVAGADAGLREQLRSVAAERLAPQFAPRRYYRADRLPRTVGGKIRRDETAALVLAGDGVMRL